MNKKVSIIIPTYCRDWTLERAISSALNQTHSNIEIIIIDDNNMNTEIANKAKVIMEKIRDLSDNVIYIKNPKNLGSAKSRNVGISKATGDYITFLDDDDIYGPNKVAKQLKFMHSNNLDMSLTDLIIKNEKDQVVDIRKHKDLNTYDQDSLLKYHLMHHLTGTDTFMYKKDLLNSIGGFDPIDIGDEFYLMVKTINSGAKIGYLPIGEVTAYIHNSNGGISTGDSRIPGANSLYEYKKKFFHKLTFREKMYVAFRHHAVLAVLGIRSKSFILTMKHAALSLICSPIDFVLEPIKLIKKVIFNAHNRK